MCSRHKLFREKQLEAQHRCEIDKIRNVSLRMEVADVNGPIDVALVDLAIKKISPVGFLKLFDALDRVLTGEEHDCVVGDAKVIKLLEHLPDIAIELDHAVWINSVTRLALRLGLESQCPLYPQ